VWVLFLLTLFAVTCYAQFSGSIQGTVQDPAGAVVPNAKIQLKNAQTGVVIAVVSDNEGNYRFISLAPGSYTISVEASGFNTSTVTFTLATSQNLNVPVSLKVASAAQAVDVTGEVPVLNTAESRNQMTLETQALSNLPLAGRNMISLVTLAPGVIGKGTVTGGSPGSGVDNYSTELQVDASANGVAIIDEFTLAGDNWPGVRAIEIDEPTVFQTYIAHRKDATLSSYCLHFVASLRGHMERLVEGSTLREGVPLKTRRAARKK
jgi:hypothetical protein